MRESSRRFAVAAPIALLLLLLTGCAGGKSLRTEDVRDDNPMTGLYTLILYRGGESIGGLKTAAFLDAEGDSYVLAPYAPPYEYTVTHHLSGQKAIEIALAFIRSSRLYNNYQMRRILDPAGKTIGYEVKPLYDALAFGVSDITNVSYLLKEGGTVQVYIRFFETVGNQVIDEY